MPVLPLTTRLRLHYLDYNPEADQTVLLLHGLGASAESWALQVPVLTQAGFRLLAPDTRGFGKSSYPGGGTRIADLAEDVIHLLEHIAIKPVAVVGISMGGTIALQLALDYPDWVDRLVLINTFASLRPRKPSIWMYFAIRFLLVHTLGLPAQARFVSRRLFPQPEEETLRHELEREITSADVHGYRAAMRALGLFNVAARLGEIQCPTLVITGAEDITVPPENQLQLATGIAGAHHIILPETGHAATVQQAEKVNQILLKFLGSPQIEKRLKLDNGS